MGNQFRKPVARTQHRVQEEKKTEPGTDHGKAGKRELFAEKTLSQEVRFGKPPSEHEKTWEERMQEAAELSEQQGRSRFG